MSQIIVYIRVFLCNDSNFLMVKIVMIMHVEIHTTFLTSTCTLCTRKIRSHKEPSNVTNPFLRWLALLILFVHWLRVDVEAEVDAARVVSAFFDVRVSNRNHGFIQRLWIKQEQLLVA
jgi:hypothetical protein